MADCLETVQQLIWMNTMRSRQPAVYLLASQPNGTLYTGVTSDLVRRIWEHRNNTVEGFTQRYRVHRLVYYELFEDMATAIAREKQIKAGPRRRKLELVYAMNPSWRDLYPDIL